MIKRRIFKYISQTKKLTDNLNFYLTTDQIKIMVKSGMKLVVTLIVIQF